MAKKMSVQEMLAAARAEKSGGAQPPASTTPAEPVAAETSAAPSEEAAKPAPAAPKAAPKPGGKLSVAEMLAAARANKSGGEAAPAKPAAEAAKPAPKPAAAKATPAKPAADKVSAGGPKDTASILAAARNTAKPGPISKAELAAREKAAEPAGKKKLVAPPMPAKPAYAKAPTANVSTDRRSFLAAISGFLFGSSLAIGFSSLAITNLMWVLGTARFMFPNILIEPPTSFKVGFADTLAPGQVETKFIPQFGVWIVRYEYEGLPMVFALKAVCTHLGCTPNWLEAEQKFKCPCHGSGFYKDGINFEGPAPRPLERYAISVADDGQLLVDKSRTFMQEQGQWKDPASFVSV